MMEVNGCGANSDQCRVRHHGPALANRSPDHPTDGGGQLEALAEKLTAGSLTPMITRLIENKKIAPDEIARIRALLNG